MGAARLRPHFQPRQAAMRGATAIVQQSLAGAVGVRRDHFHAASILILPKPIFERAGLLANVALDDSPIDFFDRAVAELAGDPRRRLAGAREQQYARSRFVEPMNNGSPRKDLARFAIFLLKILLNDPVQGLFLAVEVRGGYAARLHDGDAMIVFIQDVERG